MRVLINDGANKQLRVRFSNKLKIGFLNRKQSEGDSSVHLTHHDSRDLGLMCLVKKCKIHFRILPDLRTFARKFSGQ